MKSTSKLLAAITVSGSVLSLGIPVQAHPTGSQSELMRGSESSPLSARVERLRKKLQSASPIFHEGSAEGRIDNVVQFFKFSNC